VKRIRLAVYIRPRDFRAQVGGADRKLIVRRNFRLLSFKGDSSVSGILQIPSCRPYPHVFGLQREVQSGWNMRRKVRILGGSGLPSDIQNLSIWLTPSRPTRLMGEVAGGLIVRRQKGPPSHGTSENRRQARHSSSHLIKQRSATMIAILPALEAQTGKEWQTAPKW